MAYTPRQYRAIKRYAEDNRLKPALSAYPVIYFVNSEGNQVRENIVSLEIYYDGARKRDARERARSRQRGRTQ